MIASHADAPRWLRELERFVHLKSLLFVQGNVLDLLAYPVQDASGKVHWTESNLPGFFARFLTGLGYELCAWLDPLDGLSFTQPEMEAQFWALAENTPAQPAAAPSDRPTTTRAWTKAQRQFRSRDGTIDLAAYLDHCAPVLANRNHPAVVILNFSSRWLGNPTNLAQGERQLFLRVLKANLDCREVVCAEARWQNSLILICDRLNDLPPFLYLDNPRARALVIDKPDSQARQRFAKNHYRALHQATGTPDTHWVAEFATLTEGLAHYELLSLVSLSRREQFSAARLRELVDHYKYGVRESAWEKFDATRLRQAPELIARRLRGQDNAVSRVLTLLKRAKLGITVGGSQRQRPRGVLFFAGPTGVGKTEMAKALAELLFGSEERLVRFDMSEYAQPHADQKLLGAPPGYVGYQAGGQLTNRLKENPFAVLLFDEIEKAHPSLFDKFLQILDDGRLTDGQGETVYFSEAILIFTSNLGTVTSDAQGGRRALVTPAMSPPQVRVTISDAIRDYFLYTLGRPELLNRFGDNFVVFDFIRPPLHEAILDLLLSRLLQQLQQERGITLTLAPEVCQQFYTLGEARLTQGGRGLRNLLDTALLNPLANWLFDQASPGATVLHLSHLEDHGPDAAEQFTLVMRD